MVFQVDNVSVVFVDIHDATKDEATNYVNFIKQRVNDPDSLSEVAVITCDDGMVDVTYALHGEKFERIRRITGYLTGSLDSWNDSKRAEERDRVKHERSE